MAIANRLGQIEDSYVVFVGLRTDTPGRLRFAVHHTADIPAVPLADIGPGVFQCDWSRRALSSRRIRLQRQLTQFERSITVPTGPTLRQPGIANDFQPQAGDPLHGSLKVERI